MKVFLDPSVLVAAAATRGLCADVFRTVLAEHELLVGETVVSELARVLTEKLGMPQKEAHDVAAFVRQHSTMAAEAPVPDIDVRDPNDIPILAAALSGCSEVLVTGDKDLLVLGRINAMPVVDPRGFWQMVKGEAGE